MMEYVLRFEEINAADAGVVGAEGVKLAEMVRAALPVPPGFCLCAGAYRALTAGAYVDKTIRGVLAGLESDDPEDVEVRSEQIRNFLCAQPLPVAIGQEILQSYYQLGVESGSPHAPIPVALRSSPIAGGPHGLFGAELQDVFLNVCGEAAVLEHVKRCWGSLWTVRALTSRCRRGYDHMTEALAVVVQAMVPAEVSGSLFTASPAANGCQDIVITACWGVGHVTGSRVVTSDTLKVRKSDASIVERVLATSGRMTERAGEEDAVGWEAAPQRGGIQGLSEEQIAQLVLLRWQIERHFGAPMDVEWAYARGRVYVLQARASSTTWVL